MSKNSSSSFGFRSSFNSSGRKISRDNRKEPNATTTGTKRGLGGSGGGSGGNGSSSNHHDDRHSHHLNHNDHHHNRHNLHEKRQRSRHDNTEAEKAARSIFGDVPLTDTERRYLWSAQSGNLPALEVLVEDAASFNLCCRDYLGRTALQLSLLGEHYDCIQLLLNKLRADIIEEGLLHAIKANNVKICDMFLSQPLYSDTRARLQFLLDHQNGLYEQEDSSSSFANDITPIVLAAQCNNFDIVHMLIQKGFTISTPHNYFCLCPECQTFKDQDRVVHSKSRLNAYRGLASTAYLSLSCDDPIYAAFELSRNLEKLAEREKEHKNEYRGLSNQCKDFAVALLDQCRTNDEVMSALHGGTDTLDLARIKMAIRYDQKKFIAHASCQEQLASMWYSGAPWFQHQSFVIKLLIVPLGIMFIPLTAIVYVFVPYSKLGRILKSPFMKFMNYICSYMAFLVLLFLGTQLTSFQSVHLFHGVEGVVNSLIMFYVLGMFWAECKQLWEEGLHDYFSQMWNYMDITMLALYTAGYSIEGVIYTKADKIELSDNHLLHWKDQAIMNPQILSKILFSVANVMSFARIAYILPASETFGQLQISYGRMLQDVGKFIFIYVTVMIAFICGLTSLYSITTNTNFSGLSDTTGTLFWAAFGLGNAKAPQIGTENAAVSGSRAKSSGGGGHGAGRSGGDGSGAGGGGGSRGGAGGDNAGGSETDGEMLKVVQLVGYILYGVYILGAVVVLINMLIAMMSNTFEEIQKSEDCEWKFARAKLWISFIEQGTTLPIPFNIIPTPKSIVRMTKYLKSWVCCRQGKFDPSYEDSQKVALEYKAVMHRVVLRYIHKMKFENREDSLKEEILDTREEVIYQMHSLMGRMSYRLEILENDVLTVSRGVQAVTGGPNLLTYTKSVPSHGRSSLSSMRNASSTSLSTQDKGGSLLPAAPTHLRRGRSYYHTRPKHKLSDPIRYNLADHQGNHLTTATNTTTSTTSNISGVTNNSDMRALPHTQRSLSDSGYNNDEDASDFLGPLPPLSIPASVSEVSRKTTDMGSSNHTSHGQDESHGQGYLPVIDVTSSSGITKPIPDAVTISTISGNNISGTTPHSHSGSPIDGQSDNDFSHRRVDSLRMRGSYSPRPGEDRHRINEAAISRGGVGGGGGGSGKRGNDAIMSSNPRWGAQPDVIEESWLEDHPTPLKSSAQAGPAPLNPVDQQLGPTSHRHCGSVRRRKETMSHHPNIDAPFQPICDSNQGNTFAEYRYSKPKRRETIQNLILDVSSIHNLPGLDIHRDPSTGGGGGVGGTRTPASGGSDGGRTTSSTSAGDRKSTSPPSRKRNPCFGGGGGSSSSAKERHPSSGTPRSADESKKSPWFNWSQPFVMFYGNHSQENLYYPMQMIRRESSGREEDVEQVGFRRPNTTNSNSKDSNSNSNESSRNKSLKGRKGSANNTNSNIISGSSGISNNSGDKSKIIGDCKLPGGSPFVLRQTSNNTPTQMDSDRQTDTTSLSESVNSFHNTSDNNIIFANPTDDELHRRSVLSSSRDGKGILSTTTSTTNTVSNVGGSYQNRSMSPLTLEQTEMQPPSESPSRQLTRKVGMANIQNVNPIFLGEKSFFDSLLLNTGSDSRNMQESTTESSLSNSEANPEHRKPNASMSGTPSNAHSSSPHSNQADDLKYYDEIMQSELIPVDKAHCYSHSGGDKSNTAVNKDGKTPSDSRNPNNDLLSDKAAAAVEKQHQNPNPNPRRHLLLQQNRHYDTIESQEESIDDEQNVDEAINPTDFHMNNLPHEIHITSPQSANNFEMDWLEMDQYHPDINSPRHFSDSCVIPLQHHGNHNHFSHHQHHPNQHHQLHHHHQHPHHHDYNIQNQHANPTTHGQANRLYHHPNHHRNHGFPPPPPPGPNLSDHQRLTTTADQGASGINTNNNTNTNRHHNIIHDDFDYAFDDGDHLHRSTAFNDGLSDSDHENRRGMTRRDMYIPPMASNLIPFSVVPNSTPVHHYTIGGVGGGAGGYHRPNQDVEKQDEERSQTGGGEDTDRKRKTSSGRKISLVNLVRGRRSDKVKGKQPEIKHNRSLSLNRFGGGRRGKHLQQQRSKEV